MEKDIAMTNTRAHQVFSPAGRKTPQEESFITPEMIKRNPVLAVAGYFAGDPLWQEVQDEIERYREQRQEDALLSDAELLARHG